MKYLLIMRHAKTGEALPGQTDFERMLTDRGKRNATEAGIWLREIALIPERIFCSPAQRTKQTATLLSEALSISLDDIVFETDMYHADHEDLMNVLMTASHLPEVVMMVGHNPAITHLLNILSPESPDHMSPGCIAVLQVGPSLKKSKLLHFFHPTK